MKLNYTFYWLESQGDDYVGVHECQPNFICFTNGTGFT